MQCAFYEWREMSENVQQDPRIPKKMDLQANAMEASQLEGSDQCWTWRTDSAFMCFYGDFKRKIMLRAYGETC